MFHSQISIMSNEDKIPFSMNVHSSSSSPLFSSSPSGSLRLCPLARQCPPKPRLPIARTVTDSSPPLPVPSAISMIANAISYGVIGAIIIKQAACDFALSLDSSESSPAPNFIALVPEQHLPHTRTSLTSCSSSSPPPSTFSFKPEFYSFTFSFSSDFSCSNLLALTGKIPSK